MTDITADEYRTAAKVAREYDMLGSAGKFERLATELEGTVKSADLVTELAEVMWSVRSGNKTWESVWSHQRDTWKRYAEQALTHLTAAGRLIPADEQRLTAEQVEDVRTVSWYTGAGLSRDPMAEIHRLRALFPATEPAEEEPRKFRKKPVEVEAMQYDGKDWRSIAQWMAAHGVPMGRTASGLLRIHTLEGEMTAGSGDWIIRGVQGEFYPCKPDIFAQTYDPVSSPVGPAPTETGTNPVGLTDKYIVRRVDGSDAEGGRNFGRIYFVLSYDSDPHARAALAAYAASCETDYPELAADLRARLGENEPAAPTETEWQTWREVPEGRTVRAANGEMFRKTGVDAIHLLTNGVSDCCKIPAVTDLLPAPFVAAEEG